MRRLSGSCGRAKGGSEVAVLCQGEGEQDGAQARAAQTLFRLMDEDRDGWISRQDFSAALKRLSCRSPTDRAPTVDRSAHRILIIEQGFGKDSRQGLLVAKAGFQVHWSTSLPNPDQLGNTVGPYLNQLATDIQQFQPDLIVCASTGGAYVVALWQKGLWTGPTLMINVHPSCRQLPEGMRVVLAHGSNDEAYQLGRKDLEAISATGKKSRCFLYYTTNSGEVSPGVYTREGDKHVMKSLLLRGCLPRLMDACLCADGPETHMLRTWPERLSDARREAECWLGYTPRDLKQSWTSSGQRGRDESGPLLEVGPGSEEFEQVVHVFKEMPCEKPAYLLFSTEDWEKVRVVKVERVENGPQEEGSSRPYFQALQSSFAEQGVRFEPGVHTSWGFHGADSEALQSIVSNPVFGFQPSTSGMRNNPVWGPGAYFARDAQYVAGSHFCGPPAADGTRQMLMCLLLTGLPCLGDPDHRGVLPFREKPHRYHSSVDSLSSPEVFVMQHPSSVCPAYLITFA